MRGYIKIRKIAIEILNSKLSQKLYYHTIDHTFNVLQVINQYIKREKLDGYNAKILRIGALYHDIGFTVSNIDHEKKSCEIAEKYMTAYGFSKKDINSVKGIIIATKIPQNPQNYLEEIMCDADLDYLGRDDFHHLSNQLFKELKAFSDNRSIYEWNKAQIEFLESHHYHTEFAKKNRQPIKEKHIKKLKLLVEKENKR